MRRAGLNARRHTDIVYQRHPELTDGRRLAANAFAGDAERTKVSELYQGSGAAGSRRFGPLAACAAGSTSQSPHGDAAAALSSGLSWGEMRRHGLLPKSASEALLPTRAAP